VLIVGDSVMFKCWHSPRIWTTSDMIRPSTAGIDDIDQGLIRRLRDQRFEYALCHCRATNVAQANEEHRDWLWTGGHVNVLGHNLYGRRLCRMSEWISEVRDHLSVVLSWRGFRKIQKWALLAVRRGDSGSGG
jgi:hypothetical protein